MQALQDLDRSQKPQISIHTERAKLKGAQVDEVAKIMMPPSCTTQKRRTWWQMRYVKKL